MRTDQFLGELSDKISENPGKSIIEHSVEFKCHRSTISRSLSDLVLKSLKYKTGQLLTEAMMKNRVLKVSNLLNSLKHNRICNFTILLLFNVMDSSWMKKFGTRPQKKSSK